MPAERLDSTPPVWHDDGPEGLSYAVAAFGVLVAVLFVLLAVSFGVAILL